MRDIIAGFFVLAEDQYGVGDSVDLGLASGAVERISLRSVRLRDPEGKIWYVPHGGVARVGNLSQVTSVRLDVQVTRASKVADLHRETTELGERLVDRVGDVLTGPPVVVGLVDLSDDRLVYRMTAPIRAGRQDEVGRAWRSLLLEAFESGVLVAPDSPETVMRIDTAALGVPPTSVTDPSSPRAARLAGYATTTTGVPMPANAHIAWASAVLWRTQPWDSGVPSWASLCSGTPSLRGISWKPMLSPSGPWAKRTIQRMHVWLFWLEQV